MKIRRITAIERVIEQLEQAVRKEAVGTTRNVISASKRRTYRKQVKEAREELRQTFRRA